MGELMEERTTKFRVEIEKLYDGHSFGMCLTHSKYTYSGHEVYLYINIVFWTVCIGWFK